MASKNRVKVLTTGLSQWSQTHRWSVLLAVSALITFSVYLLFFIDTTAYQPLINSQKTSDISNTLRKAGIKFKVDHRADTVQVPADQFAKAQQALSSAQSSAHQFKGFDALANESSIGMSRFVETAQYRHALEAELAQTISELQDVKYARVHLAIPKETVFVHHKKKVSASIFLDAESNERLDPHQVMAIKQFVANSVPNLSVNDVSIIDQHGTLLSQNDESKQLFYTHMIEQDYAKRITNLLTPLLGADKVKVQVSADTHMRPKEEAAKSFPPVLLKHLSIAIAIDNLTKVDPETGNIISVPLSREEIKRITSLVKGVIGFNPARGDQLSIVNIPFLKGNKVTTNIVPSWGTQGISDKEKIILGAIILAVLLSVVVVMVLKKINPQRKKERPSAAFSSNAASKTTKPIKLNLETESNMLDVQKAPTLSNDEDPLPEYPGISNLCRQHAKMIVSFLRDNHPQIIAVLLTYLDGEKAASVLNALPSSLRSDILCRIASIGPVSPIVLKALDGVLKEKMNDTRNVTTLPTKGVKLAADIIHCMELDVEQTVIRELSTVDKKLSQRIQEQIVSFEKLIGLGSDSMNAIVHSVPMSTFMLALKGVDEKTRKTFLDRMTDSKAQQLKENLETKRPVKLSKVIAAQKEVVAIARRMIKRGEIVPSSNDKVIWCS